MNEDDESFSVLTLVHAHGSTRETGAIDGSVSLEFGLARLGGCRSRGRGWYGCRLAWDGSRLAWSDDGSIRCIRRRVSRRNRRRWWWSRWGVVSVSITGNVNSRAWHGPTGRNRIIDIRRQSRVTRLEMTWDRDQRGRSITTSRNFDLSTGDIPFRFTSVKSGMFTPNEIFTRGDIRRNRALHLRCAIQDKLEGVKGCAKVGNLEPTSSRTIPIGGRTWGLTEIEGTGSFVIKGRVDSKPNVGARRDGDGLGGLGGVDVAGHARIIDAKDRRVFCRSTNGSGRGLAIDDQRLHNVMGRSGRDGGKKRNEKLHDKEKGRGREE